MPLSIALDRSLPIPLSVQLKGQVELSVVAGTLRPGERLPSVRELAAAEGIAQVTVSHVYAALQRDGLITVRPGQGTFVSDNGSSADAAARLGDLQQLADGMVTQAFLSGFTPAQISRAVTARLATHRHRRPQIAVVGPFRHATAVYAHEIAAFLSDLTSDVRPFMLHALRDEPDERASIAGADIVLTVANRVKEVKDLLRDSRRTVHGLTFVIHPETAARLQALRSNAHLGLISTFAEFVPTMLLGVAEHIHLDRPPLCAVHSDHDGVSKVLQESDVVVFASGSEDILDDLRRGTPAIEYLHTPDRPSLMMVRRLLERLAGGAGQPRKAPRRGGVDSPDLPFEQSAR